MSSRWDGWPDWLESHWHVIREGAQAVAILAHRKSSGSIRVVRISWSGGGIIKTVWYFNDKLELITGAYSNEMVFQSLDSAFYNEPGVTRRLKS